MRIVLMAALLLTGCVTSPEEFERTRLSRSDTSLCRINQYALNHNPPMIGPTAQELQRRGITPERCHQLIAEFNQQNAALMAAGFSLMAGPRAAPVPVDLDWDWDWDQFYDSGALVWVCRGLQTGQFAEPYRCQYKMQTDWRWPSKAAW